MCCALQAQSRLNDRARTTRQIVHLPGGQQGLELVGLVVSDDVLRFYGHILPICLHINDGQKHVVSQYVICFLMGFILIFVPIIFPI
jgi:hypothetical protein